MGLRLKLTIVGAYFLLTACGMGNGSSSAPNPVTTSPPGTPQLIATKFVFAPPKSGAVRRRPSYVTSSIKSVTITLNSANGSPPPSGLTASVTSNITIASCPCTISGPNVPPGSDAFTLTAYDGNGGTGNVVSTATGTYTIAAGATNQNTVTLDGVPATLSFTSIPRATAGTPFVSAQTLGISVQDADGNTILGTYANPVTVSDADTSGATSIVTSGSDNPPVGTLLSSADTAALAYSGLAISQATLSLSATSAVGGSARFRPTLKPLTYSGPLDGGTPEIDLYATSGTGSSGTFTISEAGLTNAPYNKNVTASLASGCSSIGSLSPSSGTSFTATAVASPTSGTCTVTISDGLGQSSSVTLTYTVSSFGVQ